MKQFFIFFILFAICMAIHVSSVFSCTDYLIMLYDFASPGVLSIRYFHLN